MKNPPWKIAIVSQSFFPTMGGVTENVYNSAKVLHRHGHDVTVICPYGGEVDGFKPDFKVIYVGKNLDIYMNHATNNVALGWFLSLKMKGLLAGLNPDVTIVHHPFSPTITLAATKYAPNHRVGLFHATYEKSYLIKYLKFIAIPSLKRMSLALAVSDSCIKSNKKYFDLDYKILYNGIDLDRFNPKVAPKIAPELEVKTIVFVGRLDERKGAEYLVRAVSILQERKYKVRLVLVGAGPRQEIIEKTIAELKVQNVRLLGRQSNEDLPAIYTSGDIFCSPATGFESFGIVLLEAMASGVPVVASDIEGYRTVLQDGVQGFLAKPCDPVDLANQLEKLIKNEQLSKNMAINCRKRAEQFSWETIVNQLEQYLRELP